MNLDEFYGNAPIWPEMAAVIVPNPNRRWWQFWKPKTVVRLQSKIERVLSVRKPQRFIGRAADRQAAAEQAEASQIGGRVSESVEIPHCCIHGEKQEPHTCPYREDVSALLFAERSSQKSV